MKIYQQPTIRSLSFSLNDLFMQFDTKSEEMYLLYSDEAIEPEPGKALANQHSLWDEEEE